MCQSGDTTKPALVSATPCAHGRGDPPLTDLQPTKSVPVKAKRISTYSQAPSISALSAASKSTYKSNTSSEDSRVGDLKQIREGFARLDSQKLQKQRYTASQQKTDDLSKLALGAKLDRALDRRMDNQDAVMRTSVIKEKA